MSKRLYIILVILIVAFIFFNSNFSNFFLNKVSQIFSQSQNNNIKNSKIQGCLIKTEERIVRGSSLTPLIKPGQTIKLVYGYYNCHPVEIGDIVAYNYAGDPVPIIKIVKAVPGDKWQLKKNYDTYMIIVNSRPLRNSEGKFYQIPESNIRMLKLYVESYPALPDNTYLILGNIISGSLDATRFGLIDKSDIIGKVILLGSPTS